MTVINKKLIQAMTTFQRKIFVLLLVVVYAVSGNAQTHEDGLAAMQLENWDKAIKVYSELTKKDPTDQPAWLTLGSAYLVKGEKDKAKESFDAAFNAKSEGPYAMIASGRNLLLLSKQQEADAIFSKAEKYGKKDVAVKRLIGESFLYTMPGVKPNFTRAEEWLKKAMDVTAKDFPTLMALAYCYKEIPNGGLAAQNYEYAVNMAPKNPLPVFMLAKVYKSAKLNDKFITYVDKAIALDPKYTPALRAKMEFLYFERQWENALLAAKALINNGTDVTIDDEMLLANLLYINKDCKGVSELVEKILKKDGSKNYLLRLKAYCDYDNGNFNDGLSIMQDYFKKVDASKVLASDYLYLGRLMLSTKGDTAEAIRNMRKSIEMDPSSWKLHEEIGKIYYDAKDYCNATNAYQAFIDSLTETQALVNSYYRLGLSHYFCNEDSLRYEKAEKAFAKLTELLPDAGLGWVWRAKSMSKLEPDIENHPELLEEFGKARPHFEKFIEIAEADTASLAKNKRDMISGYEYLASYYFLNKEDEKVKMYLDKLFIIDPENESGQKIKQFMEGETPTPTSPGKNGSKGKG